MAEAGYWSPVAKGLKASYRTSGTFRGRSGVVGDEIETSGPKSLGRDGGSDMIRRVQDVRRGVENARKRSSIASAL